MACFFLFQIGRRADLIIYEYTYLFILLKLKYLLILFGNLDLKYLFILFGNLDSRLNESCLETKIAVNIFLFTYLVILFLSYLQILSFENLDSRLNENCLETRIADSIFLFIYTFSHCISFLFTNLLLHLKLNIIKLIRIHKNLL